MYIRIIMLNASLDSALAMLHDSKRPSGSKSPPLQFALSHVISGSQNIQHLKNTDLDEYELRLYDDLE